MRDRTYATAKEGRRKDDEKTVTVPTGTMEIGIVLINKNLKTCLSERIKMNFTHWLTKTLYEEEREFINKKIDLQPLNKLSRSREGMTLSFDSSSTQNMTVVRLRPNHRRCHPRDNRQKPVSWGPFFWRDEIFPNERKLRITVTNQNLP